MDHRKNLYDKLNESGVYLGTYDEYSSKIGDTARAKNLYDKLTSSGINMGPYDKYMEKLGHGSYIKQQSDSVYAGMTGAQMMRGAGRGAQNASGGMQNTSSRTVNPVTGQVSGGGSIATNREPGEQRAGNSASNREARGHRPAVH